MPLVLRSACNTLGPLWKTQGDQGEVHTVEDAALAPLEVSEAMQLASATENTDPGAFEPHTIAAARCSLDWSLCEKAIEETSPPDPSDQRGRAVRPLQPAYIDATFHHHHLAVLNSLPSTDHQVPLPTHQASACTAECAITRDVPYREAADTTWAALATPPAITLSNMNGDTAVDLDRHATSGHASPIDGGTTPPLSKQQEGVSSPSRATRSSAEVCWARRPVSHVFGDLESHPIPISFPDTNQPSY